MASRLEKLMFSVALIDKASGPISKLTSNLDNMVSRSRKGMEKIGVGAAGLFSTGYALNSLMQPATEMDRAIGEVKSLGVRDSALKKLEKTALATSIRFGESATDIVRSSYDIQSAIAGLSDNELAKFTQASAILAKGTKSDAGTITDYMGTMYGIFQNTADSMGKARWVQQLTDQTASAVQMFKTTGSEMAGAFANLGAEATSHGVAMSEQMAILGTLQATMSGSEAGTKYKSFLAGVGKAQDQLGLSFTDSQGKLLPMVDILEKLRGKFGDTFDVAESDMLKKAFGSKEATGLIKLLMQNTEGLNGSIEQLGSITGDNMNVATGMAKDMIDPWQQWDAVIDAVKTSFGRALQPALHVVLNLMIRGAAMVQSWTEKFPTATRVIGFTTLAVFGLVAALSAITLASGVMSMAMGGFSAVMAVAKVATLLFNAALWANPLTWVVAGIVALIAAIALAVVYWDKIKATLEGLVVFQMARIYIDLVVSALSALWDVVMLAAEGWGLLLDAFIDSRAVQGVLTLFNNIGKAINTVGSGIGWLIDKLIALNGMAANVLKGIADNGVISTVVGFFSGDDDPAKKVPAPQKPNAGGDIAVASRVPVGGLQQSINNNRGTTIEKVEVNTTGGVNGFQLADELALAGG